MLNTLNDIYDIDSLEAVASVNFQTIVFVPRDQYDIQSVMSLQVYVESKFIEIDEKLETALTQKVDKSELGKSVATLVNGKIPSDQLPSFVDDVLEYDTFDDMPETGEKGLIYVDLSTNNTYRWSGTEYIKLTDLSSYYTKTETNNLISDEISKVHKTYISDRIDYGFTVSQLKNIVQSFHSGAVVHLQYLGDTFKYEVEKAANGYVTAVIHMYDTASHKYSLNVLQYRYSTSMSDSAIVIPEGTLKPLVSTTDYATNEIGGVLRGVASFGFTVDSYGRGQIVKATKSDIDAATNEYKPIVSEMRDYTIMKALSDCKDTSLWTEDSTDESGNLVKGTKTKARELLGVPKETYVVQLSASKAIIRGDIKNIHTSLTSLNRPVLVYSYDKSIYYTIVQSAPNRLVLCTNSTTVITLLAYTTTTGLDDSARIAPIIYDIPLSGLAYKNSSFSDTYIPYYNASTKKFEQTPMSFIDSSDARKMQLYGPTTRPASIEVQSEKGYCKFWWDQFFTEDVSEKRATHYANGRITFIDTETGLDYEMLLSKKKYNDVDKDTVAKIGDICAIEGFNKLITVRHEFDYSADPGYNAHANPIGFSIITIYEDADDTNRHIIEVDIYITNEEIVSAEAIKIAFSTVGYNWRSAPLPLRSVFPAGSYPSHIKRAEIDKYSWITDTTTSIGSFDMAGNVVGLISTDNAGEEGYLHYLVGSAAVLTTTNSGNLSIKGKHIKVRLYDFFN